MKVPPGHSTASEKIDSAPVARRRTPGGIALALALALLLTACGGPKRYQSLPIGTPVLAFGDSVTFGTGAGGGEDYPSRLAAISGWQVINAGIPGDTAREARKRLGALLDRHQPALVIIELGGNDFLRKRGEDLIRQDLEAMVRESQGSGAIAALVAVPRLSLLRARAGALKDSAIYADVAKSTGTLLIENVFSDVLSDDALRADAIHPNREGYQQLAQGIAEQLREGGLLAP